uniref:Transmembrane protein n=1 Tax=Panagrellus redivivus TaxID=6233 RepID=A0A7E4V0N2_PANRE
MPTKILLISLSIFTHIAATVAKKTKDVSTTSAPKGKSAADYVTFTVISLIVLLILCIIGVGGLILYLIIYRRRNGPRADPFRAQSQERPTGGQRYGYESVVPGNDYAGFNQLTPGLEPDHIEASAFRHEGALEMQLPGTRSLENRIDKSGEGTTTSKNQGSSEFAKSNSAHVEFDQSQFIVKDIGPGVEVVKNPKGEPLAPQPTGNEDNYPGKKHYGPASVI